LAGFGTGAGELGVVVGADGVTAAAGEPAGPDDAAFVGVDEQPDSPTVATTAAAVSAASGRKREVGACFTTPVWRGIGQAANCGLPVDRPDTQVLSSGVVAAVSVTV
jgi:hypothetical protein